MRIVSQNKTTDISYGNCALTIEENNSILARFLDTGQHLLGKYSSEERALEVLQDMRDMYGDFLINPVHTVTKKEEAIYNLKTEKEEIHKTVKRKSNIFFYMPKE